MSMGLFLSAWAKRRRWLYILPLVLSAFIIALIMVEEANLIYLNCFYQYVDGSKGACSSIFSEILWMAMIVIPLVVSFYHSGIEFWEGKQRVLEVFVEGN